MFSFYVQKERALGREVTTLAPWGHRATRVTGVVSLSFVMNVAVGCSGENQSVELINGQGGSQTSLAMYKGGAPLDEQKEFANQEEHKEPPPPAVAAPQLGWQKRVLGAIEAARTAGGYDDLRAQVLRRVRGELNGLKGRIGNGGQLGYWSSGERGEELVKLGSSALPLVMELLWEKPGYESAPSREKEEQIKALFKGLHGLAEATGGDVQASDIVELELDLFEHSSEPSVRHIAALTTLGQARELAVAQELVDRVTQSLHNALMEWSGESEWMPEAILGAMIQLSGGTSPKVRQQVADDVLTVLKGSRYPSDLRELCVYKVVGTSLVSKSDVIPKLREIRGSLDPNTNRSLIDTIDFKVKQFEQRSAPTR